MKTCYALISSFVNGTVTARSEISLFPSIELAQVVGDKIKEKNSDLWIVFNRIEKVYYYETLAEVPIMQEHVK
jgi:hypothetical protein